MERLNHDSDPLELGMAGIVAQYRVQALIGSIKALAEHYDEMARRYGDKAMRDWNTVRYLNGIDARMAQCDHVERQRLSERRALLTKLCTDEEIDQAIELAK